jgi:GAF domain-containing protein
MDHPDNCAAADGDDTPSGTRYAADTRSLARELSELARQLQAETDPEALMRRITSAAVRQVGGAAAGITLVSRRGVQTQAPTDDLAQRIDHAQYEFDEGPCLDSARRQTVTRCDDLRADKRWPRFAPRASALGVLSTLSVPLFVEGNRYGALNVYSTDLHAFTDDDETVGMLLASHAAIALHGRRTVANLRNAMDIRDLVGQAKGILMERYGIGQHDAFDLLTASSQATNRKLTDIARALVDSGVLPVPPTE